MMYAICAGDRFRFAKDKRHAMHAAKSQAATVRQVQREANDAPRTAAELLDCSRRVADFRRQAR